MTVPPTVELRTGYDISSIIKGGWQLSGDHGSVEKERAVHDMIAFYDAGITTFDCADIYTGVEAMLGNFRQALHKSRGADAVQAIRVHTKYVPDIGQLATLSEANITCIINRSLQRLQLEQLDLVQFHWWDYTVPGYLETMKHLQTLRKAGKINRIGVTNFDAEHLEKLCAVGDIVSAQIQYSLLDQRPAGEFARLAREHNVHLLSYGVLAGGFLTDAWLGTDDPGFEFTNRSLVKYRLVIEEFGGWPVFQQLLTVLRQVADRHSVDIDTVALCCMLRNKDTSAIIVGARYAERLPDTLRAVSLQLDAEDHALINTVLQKSEGPKGSVFGLERDTGGRHGRIMKYNINSGDTTQHRHVSQDREGGERA